MPADGSRSNLIRPSLAGPIGAALVTVWIAALSIFVLGAAGRRIIDGHLGAGAFLAAIAGIMTVPPSFSLQWGFQLARRNRSPGREHAP
jgi:hypothetical protein